ncbi:MAG: hypothetical protein J5879_01370 [Clostridia bacterium]|nr:hypothetical protein [Clostridia bacterium]
MKKIFAVLICIVMICAAAVPVFAGKDDDVVKSIQLDLCLEIEQADVLGFQMRGFTVSPDGKYLYCGFLQNYRTVVKYDAETLEYIDEYVPEVENDEVTADQNYPKGLAVDCRGYLFVGITHDVPATPYISLACVDGNMQEVSVLTEKLDGCDKTGINGVASQKIGDKILVYLVTCYEKDTIRCYDVTDVHNIKPYDKFGVEGVIDYNELTGSQADPGYLTVDTDGYIYLCYLKDNSPNTKGSNVIKIQPDGKAIVSEIDVREAYGICTAGDYLFVATHDDFDSCVHVIDKNTMEEVTVIDGNDPDSAFSGIGFANGYLWVGMHGNNPIAGAVLRSVEQVNLTRDSKETEMVETEALTARPEETTEPATEPETTEAPATTEAGEEKTEPVTTTAADPSAEETTKAPETTKPSGGSEKKDSNLVKTLALAIGIPVAVIALIVIIVVIIISAKKKKK